MTKGEAYVYIAKGLVALLNAAAKNINGGKEITPVRGRVPTDWESFQQYIMSTPANERLSEKFVRWLTLDAEHEFERVRREREERAAARNSVDCVL